MHSMSHLKTKAVLILTLIAISFSAFAQAPNLLNYQGVARNSVGNPIANQKMNLRLSVHNLSATGTIVYMETREITTNLGGLFSVQVGSAGTTSTTGTIGGISWLSGDKYLQVEIDPANNSKFFDIGVVQLVSVPYAFNAVTAANALTVTTNANLTGAVTSNGNVTTLAASPTLTGVPTAPTAAPGTNTTQIATTEFVKAAALTGPKGEQGIQGLTGSVSDVAAISETSTANGASITSGVLSLAPADATNGGIVTNGAQIFAGDKTFNNTIIGSISGNASTATRLATPRNINGVAFDGSRDITISSSADASNLTGIVPIAKGGTGQTTVNGILTTLGFLGNNIAIGQQAGTIGLGVNANTIAIGGGAGKTSQGQSSISIGYVAGYENQGVNSLAIGGNAAQVNQGNEAVALGYAAGQTNQGVNAVAIGKFAGQYSQRANSIAINASGINLSATNAGFYVSPVRAAATTADLLFYNSTTKEITSAAGGIVTTGAQTFTGDKTFSNLINGISVGAYLGVSNTMLGNNAFSSSTPGVNNTALGYKALSNAIGGNDNTAIGANALSGRGSAPENGWRNTAVGVDALKNGGGGADNVAIGFLTLPNTSGGANTAVGMYALLSNTSATANVAVGAYAQYGTTDGINNTSIGTASMALNASGAQNTVMGANAIEKNISGSNNTVLGFSAGKYFSNLVSSSTENSYLNNSVLIGASSRTLALNSINEVVIGYNAVGNGSNTIQLGNTDISNVKTSGKITAGTITYPNTSGSINQVLTTNGSGTASWATVAAANAAAGTLTGTTLNSTVTGSSLTSVGTLTSATINGKVIVGASSAASSSAVLEASSTTQGFLPPRMTYAQKTAIVSPSQGLIIYCTNCGANGEVEVYNGAAWTHISGSSAAAIVVIPEVTSLTGRIWMDRNLGASQVATSSTDYLAYGSLYQWGRGSDGHQQVTWTNSTTGTLTNATTSIRKTDDLPGNVNFILIPGASPYDWRNPQNNDLWQDVNGVNNPCPAGYRLPTDSEWDAERLSWSSNNATGAYTSPLKLPMAAIQLPFIGGSYLAAAGSEGYYWTSSVTGISAKYLTFNNYPDQPAPMNRPHALMAYEARANGMSVRCIKD